MYILIKNLLKKINRIVYKKKFRPKSYISNDFGFSRGSPIDRYYINNFFLKNSNYINNNVLEFGDNYYFKKFCKHENSTCDIFTSILDKRNDNIKRIHCDLTKIEPKYFGKYDCVICTNVLNFIFDTKAAISGISNMLKPGGICIVTLAGFSTHISRYDYDRWGDYWRFSDLSAIKLFENYFDIIFIKNYGNVYSAIAQMNGFCVEELELEKVNEIENDYVMITGIVLKKKIINA